MNGWLITPAAVMQAVVSDYRDEERAEVYSKTHYSPHILPGKNVDVGQICKTLCSMTMLLFF